jgi:hypothetical protein
MQQNRLFERTQAVLVFIQSDIAAPKGTTRGAPAWLYRVHLDKTGRGIKGPLIRECQVSDSLIDVFSPLAAQMHASLPVGWVLLRVLPFNKQQLDPALPPQVISD